jgi:riboflavin synthase
MFTGLIEEVGTLRKIEPMRDGRRLFIEAQTTRAETAVDDSVAVNGICLTVVKLDPAGFWVEAVGETLRKTTLKSWRIGQPVNLERALRLNDRLGGHLVQGHVNGVGKITQLSPRGENYFLEVEMPRNLLRYCVAEGSIAIDGISLTIARLNGTRLGVSVIPHTFTHTNLRNRHIGDAVNVETDIIAKYVERLLGSRQPKDGQQSLDQGWLKQMGF